MFKVVVLDGSFAVWSEKHGEEIATGLTLAQAQAEVDALTIESILPESHTPAPVPCTFKGCAIHECSYCGTQRAHQDLMPVCDCSDLIAEDGSDDVVSRNAAPLVWRVLNDTLSTKTYVTELAAPTTVGWDREPATHIVRWYNRYERAWVVSYGTIQSDPWSGEIHWQVGASEYVASLIDALAWAEYLAGIAAR